MSEVLSDPTPAQTTAIASGDSEAFARFFREWFDVMYADARRATGRDEAFCLDVVQDAMMRVIRSMRPMDSADRMRNWLRVVVKTCAYDRLRKEIRQRGREADHVRPPEEAPPADDTAERVAWLQQELEALDEPQAQLLVMRFRFGWTLQRIGRTLGIEPPAVHGRVTRTLRALRRRARTAFPEAARREGSVEP